MTEQWKPIKGYEGIYEVSTFGRVKSLQHSMVSKDGKIRHFPEVIKKLSPNWSGYLLVGLSKEGRSRTKAVHRLVAQAFLQDTYKPGLQINHIDQHKANNRVDNLEWVTPSENVNYMDRNERSIATRRANGGERSRIMKASKPIRATSINGGYSIVLASASKASRKLHVNLGHICQAALGRRKSAGGFTWQYIEGGDRDAE